MGNQAVFVGQANRHGLPEGICRVIDENGDLYEGNVLPDGSFGGWLRFISDNGLSIIGWRDTNQKRHGNIMRIEADGSENYGACGWYENNILSPDGKQKEDPIHKAFKPTDCFENGVY